MEKIVTGALCRAALTLLLIAGSALPAAAQSPQEDLLERQVIVMFETDAVSLPPDLVKVAATRAQVVPALARVLERFEARELARGYAGFRRSDTLRVLADGRRYRTQDYTKLFVITLPEGVNRDSVVAHLERLPFVRYAEKNQRVVPRTEPARFSFSTQRFMIPSALVTPNDPYFSQQWGLKNSVGPDIRAEQAWELSKGSTDITLGVVDTGTDFHNHPDLNGRFTGASTPGANHGTAVAGIIGAKTNNGTGVAGVDWNARIHVENTSFDLTYTAQSIDRTVAAGARAINNSWGYVDRSILLTNALFNAYRANVLIVQANPYQTGGGNPNATSNYPNEIAPWMMNVGAMTQNGGAFWDTGVRSFTDVGAPGEGVYSTQSGGTYGSNTGTSFAAPHVTGIAGLLLAKNPSLRNYDLEQIIKRTAQNYPIFDSQIGYGMVDAYEALRFISAPNVVTHGPAQLSRIYSNTTRTFVNSPAPDLGSGTYYGVDVYKLSASGNFSYGSNPIAWLSIGESGMSVANPNNAQRWISESVSPTSYSATTYFYFMRTNLLGQQIDRWLPFDPTVFERDAGYEYTAIGLPQPPLTAWISGPDWLTWRQQGTYTASYSGGSGSASYHWYSRTLGTSTWYDTGITTKTYSFLMSNTTGVELKVNVTRGSENASPTKTVQYCTGSSCGALRAAHETALPEAFALHGAAPNPVRDAADVRFDVPEQAHVRLTVFDVMGREVARLVDDVRAPGTYTARFESGGLPSGVYLVRMVAEGGSFQQVQRVTVVR